MIPSNLKYQNKVESSQSRSYRSNISPQNGTGPYTSGQTIIFNLPCIQNTVTPMSENYLKFNLSILNVVDNEYIRFDSQGAHGLIQSIRVTSASNQLEYINNYGVLAKQWFDLQVSPDNSFNKQNLLVGTRCDSVSFSPTFAAADITTAAVADPVKIATKLSNIACKNLQINNGIRLNINSLAEATPTYSFNLNLISMIGTLSTSQYFPLFACNSGPLRVEITLVPSIMNGVCSGVALNTFSLTDVEYVMQVIEIGDQCMNLISQSLGNSPLQYVIPQYSNFVSSATLADNILLNIPIPAKYASVKAFYSSFRDTGTIASATYFPYSSNTFNLYSYVWKIGYKNIPAKAPATYIEMFSELLKSVGSMSDVLHTPAIDIDSYCNGYNACQATAIAAQGSLANTTETLLKPNRVNSGSFMIGLDLENWVNADKSQIWSGYNTNSEDCYLQLQYQDVLNTPTIRIDTFCLYDCLLTFTNGICYAST